MGKRHTVLVSLSFLFPILEKYVSNVVNVRDVWQKCQSPLVRISSVHRGRTLRCDYWKGKVLNNNYNKKMKKRGSIERQGKGLLLRPIHSYCKMPRSHEVNWKWSHKNYDILRPPADRQLPRLYDGRPGNHCLYVFFINSLITDRKHGE
jgi:hypothetical protein